jgi:integrase
MAARKLRNELLARRGRGETVAPDARLRFGEAAELWLAGPVLDLRPATQAGYRSAVEQHLWARFGNRRLDSITADDLAKMVRDLRQAGKSEATIHAVLGAAGRIYKFAARRLGFNGVIPTSLMLPSERPKVSLAARRPIFTPGQIEQTLAAATEPYRTLFTVAALTGGRVSELCGLTWADVRLEDLDEAEITFAWQVDRHGNRRPTKTDGSARTIPIPRELGLVLARHKLAARYTNPGAFVFATCSGRPLSQRNVARALRRAQQLATDEHGRPTFPALHEQGVSRRRTFNALLQAHRSLPGPACGRECGRGRVLPRTSRRDSDTRRLRPRDRRRQAPPHAPLKDDGRVQRSPPNRTRRRRVDLAKPSRSGAPVPVRSGGASRFKRLPNRFHPPALRRGSPEPTPGLEPGTPSLRVKCSTS